MLKNGGSIEQTSQRLGLNQNYETLAIVGIVLFLCGVLVLVTSSCENEKKKNQDPVPVPTTQELK